MTINVDGQEVKFEKVDYDLAYYIYNTELSQNEDLCKKCANKLWYFDDYKYDRDVIAKAQKIIGHHTGKNRDEIDLMCPLSLIKLFEHCRKHNKYNAKVWYKASHCFGSFRKGDWHYNTDKILKIDDDECLCYLLDLIAFISTKDTLFQANNYTLYCIIEYFLKDYEEYKEQFKQISENFRKCNYESDEYEQTYILAMNMVYQMFLEYNDEFLFIGAKYASDSHLSLRLKQTKFSLDNNGKKAYELGLKKFEEIIKNM